MRDQQALFQLEDMITRLDKHTARMRRVDIALLSVQLELMTLLREMIPGFADPDLRLQLVDRLALVGKKIEQVFERIEGADDAAT